MNEKIERRIPAKVGTQPMLILLDRRMKLAIGKRIRFKINEVSSEYFVGIVDKLDPILFVSLI